MVWQPPATGDVQLIASALVGGSTVDSDPVTVTVAIPGDADLDGDVDYGENPLTGDGDGVSYLNILVKHAGTTSGAI